MTVVQQDVAEVLRAQRGSFDSIVMDIDNGPVALRAGGNDRLYQPAGLKLIRAVLRPEGCVAFWSAAPDPAFEELMVRAGFLVETQNCRSRLSSGRRHTLFLGRLE